LARRKRRR